VLLLHGLLSLHHLHMRFLKGCLAAMALKLCRDAYCLAVSKLKGSGRVESFFSFYGFGAPFLLLPALHYMRYASHSSILWKQVEKIRSRAQSTSLSDTYEKHGRLSQDERPRLLHSRRHTKLSGRATRHTRNSTGISSNSSLLPATRLVMKQVVLQVCRSVLFRML